VPRRIFIHVLKREEVTGGWKQLHNMDLNNLYSSSNIIRVTKSRKKEWPRHVAHKEEIRNVYKFFARKFKGNGRSMRIRKDSVKTDLREIWYEDMTWIKLALDRVPSTW
jgi:hypothetical protein